MDLQNMINLQKEEALKVIAGYEIELEKVKELLADRMQLIDSLQKERDYIQRALEKPKMRLSELRR